MPSISSRPPGKPSLTSGDWSKRWLDQLELEHDNLRSALRRAIDAGNAKLGLELIAALWRFWQIHGHLDEGRRWSELVLALPASSERGAGRFRGLTALGGLAYWQEDVPATRRAYEEALSIAREMGDRSAEAKPSTTWPMFPRTRAISPVLR